MAEKTSGKNLEQALSELSAGFKTKVVRRTQFVTSVMSIAEDHSSAKVRLCTGSVIDVPMSVLKNVTYLGTATSEDERLGIASGEIDVSTDVGVLIQQMAQEINRVSRSLQMAQEGLLRLQGAVDINNTSAQRAEEIPAAGSKTTISPLDTVLPVTIVKIPFTGVAGSPSGGHGVGYGAPAFQYIQEWEVLSTQNCFMTQPPFVNERDDQGHILQLYFHLDAAHGTPIGTTYNATISFSVVLVQRTT